MELYNPTIYIGDLEALILNSKKCHNIDNTETPEPKKIKKTRFY